MENNIDILTIILDNFPLNLQRKSIISLGRENILTRLLIISRRRDLIAKDSTLYFSHTTIIPLLFLKAHLLPRVIAVVCFCFEMRYCPNAWSDWLNALKRVVSCYTKFGISHAMYFGRMWAFKFCYSCIILYYITLLSLKLVKRFTKKLYSPK